MPFTGGAVPSPERYGGGENNTNVPVLQRVYESIAAARGSAYDQVWPPATAVAAENFALARAIALDLHGGNKRLANQFNPLKSTVGGWSGSANTGLLASATSGGLLPRWEAILGTPPNYGDTEPVRRARVAAAFARLGVANGVQAVVDQINLALGPLYGGLTTFTPSNSTSWWPGLSGNTAGVTLPGTGGLATVTGLVGLPSAVVGQLLTLGNTSSAGNAGTFPIHDYVGPTEVKVANPNYVEPDYGVGGSPGASTMTWAVSNPKAPFMSTVQRLDILALLPAGYYTLVEFGSQKAPNSAWYQAVGALNPVLDAMLPAWVTWCVYINNTAGVLGIKVGEPAIGIEALGA
jgi:hypothetical protein